ncbi:hypothetical protein AVEN_176553-1 [Araneus ventricosus]|uniref:Uncharacterized protein n=1 Tax=Araneus ventricosus TaxID=182803 RepID=A0A4Y2VEX2_ARAVE|nr:hypothetical protein AVEN_176553-1 [Araneus ventricosus]
MKKCSSKAFTSSVQVEFLKKRLRIVSVLEEIEEVFSKSTFIVCTANFTACMANLAQILVYASENTALTLLEVFFISSITVASMVSIFFSAGKISVEMQRFSAIARRHFEHRVILGLSREDTGARSLFLDGKFTMSGCQLILYKRSTILTVLGTILTYGLLILNLDLETNSKN